MRQLELRMLVNHMTYRYTLRGVRYSFRVLGGPNPGHVKMICGFGGARVLHLTREDVDFPHPQTIRHAGELQ